MSKFEKRQSWAKESQRSRLYGARWRKARESFLTSNPLCVFCGVRGRVTAATVVDHIVPHRGNEALFWSIDNWQPLCQPCHDGAKQELEQTGTLRGCDVDGIPVDPGHPWSVAGQ